MMKEYLPPSVVEHLLRCVVGVGVFRKVACCQEFKKKLLFEMKHMQKEWMYIVHPREGGM